MLKKIHLILIILFTIITAFTMIKISSDKNEIIKNIQYFYDSNKPIGKIIIKKININHNLYSIESSKNNIEENITILDSSITPDKKNSILIIAAHSGTGEIAYFEELNQLAIKDEIIIIYKGKKYIYTVKEIWEEKKNGYININKESKKQLVLTTCSPTRNNYQLVINCIEKEST